jgi:signal transduction histidine kinase
LREKALMTTDAIPTRRRSFNPWHFVWISVIISEFFTALLNVVQSFYWYGKISPRLIAIGAVDAVFVPVIAASIAIYFIRQTEELKQLNMQLVGEIAERKRVEEEKDKLHGERIAEKERHLAEKERLLMDIHDGIGGITTNIRLLSELSQRMNDVESIKKTLTTISQLSQDAIFDIRTLMKSLDSNELSWHALVSTLRSDGANMVEAHGLRFEIEATVDGAADQTGSVLWVNLLRIYKEALMNVIKHAQGRYVLVALKVSDDELQLRVQDDGIGWDGTATCGRGLLNMKKRAHEIGGTVTVSSPGKGTQVSLKIPFPLKYTLTHAES